MAKECATNIVKALESANRGSAHSCHLAPMSYDILYGLTMHSDILAMHLVTLYLFTLHRFEGACSHMKGHLIAVYMMLMNILKNGISEMQTSSRSCYTSLDSGIDCLIGGLVALLSLSVQVWRNRQFAYGIEYLRERDITSPREIEYMTNAILPSPFHREFYLFVIHPYSALERTSLPFLQIAHQTNPRALGMSLEYLFVIARHIWFEQECLD